MPSPLASPRLRRIILAYTVNRLGSWVGLVALSLAVFDHTHSALAVAALLFAWQALPAFVVPALVARVEASSRGRELSGLYFFEAIVTALLAILLSRFSLLPLLLLAALDGTAALAASALLRAAVARAGREQAEEMAGGTGLRGQSAEDAAQEAERRANAALNVAFSVAFIGGPILGGAITAAIGAPAALLIDVGSFAICGALLIDLHPHVEEAGGDSVRARLHAAWRHVSGTPALRTLLLVETLTLLFVEAAGPIELVFARATLGAGDRGYGLLVTAWGAGYVLGSVVFARMTRRSLGLLLSAGTLALGTAFVGYAAAPTLALACVAAGVGGVGNAVEWPALISLVQGMSPQQLHGRMMGAVESLASICLAAGLALGGALVALTSPRAAFLVIGVGAVTTAGVFARLTMTGLQAQTDEGAPARAISASTPPEPAPE